MWVAVRLGAAVALLAPLGVFAVRHVLAGGTTAGFVVALVDGALASLADWLAYLVEHPVKAVVYALVLWVVSKVAFHSS